METIRKNQSEMKDTLIKIKNNSHGSNSRVDEAENQINDLEHKEAKNNHAEQEEKRIPQNEDNTNSLWDNFKRSNICLIGVPEGEEKEQEILNLFEKNNERKHPQFGEGNRSTENPKQDGCKEVHSKTHHN